jgi:hypothetical protein
MKRIDEEETPTRNKSMRNTGNGARAEPENNRHRKRTIRQTKAEGREARKDRRQYK